jgi:ApeA N-terminal domain 1
LHVCGEDSKLTLFDDAEFNPYFPEIYAYIVGELYDGRLVTLLQCNLLKTEITGVNSERRKHCAQLFPHYVAFGPAHIPNSLACISQISFAMKDASALFYDFDAFSTVLDPKPFGPLLQNDKAQIRHIDIGEHPIIGYFTGKFDIAIADTVLGRVCAHHSPKWTSGGPQGLRIDNEVMVTMTPTESLTFKEGLNQLSVLLRFFELILGREQPLKKLNVRLCSQSDRSSTIDVHRSLAPDSNKLADPEESRSIGPRDALICTIDSSEQYSTVLNNYLASDNERHDSRGRLRNALNTGRFYTIDRIISAANIFDIFPDSAYPVKVELPDDLAAAKEETQKLFKSLPDTIERNSILNAIGRIGKLSLKHKIRHRITSTGLDKHFPQLIEVLNEAVNCRNHYVHGSRGKVDYSANFDLVIFFTDALEFSFAVSDLIDVGWSITCLKGGDSHPFHAFAIGYQPRLHNFNTLMNQAG